MRTTFIGLGLVLLLVSALSFQSWPVKRASAWTSYEIQSLNFDGDVYYNYDFESQAISVANVDFEVSLVFADHADINTIKADFASQGYPNGNNNEEFFLLNSQWTSDQGIKTNVYAGNHGGPETTHFRLYAAAGRAHAYNDYWGNYILATSHYDVNEESPNLSSHKFGWSEDAAGTIAAAARQLYGYLAVCENCAQDGNQYNGIAGAGQTCSSPNQCTGVITQ
ncbi:MAG: hypothetical protein ACR2PL_00890 [Dehalococcoidia bacterium]